MSDLERAMVTFVSEVVLVGGGAMMATGFISSQRHVLLGGIAATLLGALIRR